MRRFLLEQSKRDVVTSHSGLALVGLCLNRHSDAPARADEHLPCGGVASSDVIRSYTGLLTLGQSDFEAVTARREDRTFRQSRA